MKKVKESQSQKTTCMNLSIGHVQYKQIYKESYISGCLMLGLRRQQKWDSLMRKVLLTDVIKIF